MPMLDTGTLNEALRRSALGPAIAKEEDRARRKQASEWQVAARKLAELRSERDKRQTELEQAVSDAGAALRKIEPEYNATKGRLGYCIRQARSHRYDAEARQNQLAARARQLAPGEIDAAIQQLRREAERTRQHEPELQDRPTGEIEKRTGREITETWSTYRSIERRLAAISDAVDALESLKCEPVEDLQRAIADILASVPEPKYTFEQGGAQ